VAKKRFGISRPKESSKTVNFRVSTLSNMLWCFSLIYLVEM
jgi:hypothetical protein